MTMTDASRGGLAQYLYNLYMADKRCTGCNLVKPLSDYSPDRRARDGHQPRCKACRLGEVRAWKAANPDKHREGRKKYGASLRNRVLAHYGPVCACCGSVQRLCVDHVNGDGQEHRERLGGSGRGMVLYRWLIKNDFPGGFQVLCLPCNTSKRGGSNCQLNHPAAAGEVKGFSITISFPARLAAMVRQRALDEGVTISEMVRNCVSQALEDPVQEGGQ